MDVSSCLILLFQFSKEMVIHIPATSKNTNYPFFLLFIRIETKFICSVLHTITVLIISSVSNISKFSYRSGTRSSNINQKRIG